MEPKDFKGKMVVIPPRQFCPRERVMYCAHVDDNYHFLDWMGNGERINIKGVDLREATPQEIADAATKDCKLIAQEYDFE